MIVIERPRNKGKTTILLHYMTIDFNSIYVARTDSAAKRAFQFSQILELDLDESRFIGMANLKKLRDFYACGYKILVDDADYITTQYPAPGFNLIKSANIITITKGKR